MNAQPPRTKRRMFAAKVELTDVTSGAQVIGNTKDLSISGLRVHQTTLPVGSKVRVRIVYRGMVFASFGRVVWVQPDGNTGIAFTNMEDKNSMILDQWLHGRRQDG